MGPGLTFAFREAVFGLADMEGILVEADRLSHIKAAVESAMLENPSHWQKHYAGTPQQQKHSRFYSFSDRIRYYWPVTGVHSAFERLMANFGDKPLPLSLVSQYLPRQYEQIRSGRLKNHPRALLLGRVKDVLDDYQFAAGHNGQPGE